MRDLYDSFESVKDSYEEYKDNVDKFKDGIEKINTGSNIIAYNYIYNSSTATEEMKQYAVIEIMDGFFSLAGDSIGNEYGGQMFAVFDSNYVQDGYDICGKRTFQLKLYDLMRDALNEGNAEVAEAYNTMYTNIDESYEAYKIAIEECCKNDFPTTKKEWDMFYKNYQENNDPEEIFDNMNSWLDDLAENLGLYDDSTFLGHLNNVWSDFLCNKILTAPQRLYYYLEKKIKNMTIEDACDQIDKSIDSTNLPEHEKERLKEQMKKIFCTDEIKTATVDSLKDVKSSFTSATTARRVLYDPIILDLDGDGTVDNGIKLTA